MGSGATINVFEDRTFTPGSRHGIADRRSDFDVTNTVQVSSVGAVRGAVQTLFQEAFPQASFDPVWIAFHDFDQLFEGLITEYEGCDTIYHDKQHSLDVTLATARLIVGHEKRCPDNECLGPDRAVMGLVSALFHDAGYIRRADEPRRLNGAEFTIWHVSRSADFLAAYLPRIGFGKLARTAERIVHFTGYEINLDDIRVADRRDRLTGHLLGTADLIAQMADRCYLEKCRDRLYAEFVLAGVAVSERGRGKLEVLYGSGIDLLKKTSDFVKESARVRLEQKFNGIYRNIEALYDGHNPYTECIEHNLAYLRYLIENENWSGLRRNPPCFTILENPLRSVGALVSRHLAELDAPACTLTTP